MTAIVTRTSSVAFKEEVTQNTLISPAAGDFVAVREGMTVSQEVEQLATDEMVNNLGNSKPYRGMQKPKGSFPKYLRHSGVEGTAPEYSVLIKSAMGTQTTNATEYDTIAGSTAGTSLVRGTLVVDSGEGSNFIAGQAVLIKDTTNGYSIRNVRSISTDTLSLNCNTSSATPTLMNLGKAIHFSPAKSGHVSFSAHHFGARAASGFYEAISGCRTTNMNIDFTANNLAEINFDFEGMQYYYNPITVSSSNNKIDFDDDAGTTDSTATLTSKVYRSPHELAAEVATQMTAQSVGDGNDTISCSYSDTTGKFTISTSGSLLSLNFSSGANTANTAATILGFATSDQTSATTYTSGTAQTYNPAVTPTYDSSDSLVIRDAELLIGDFDQITSRKCLKASFSVSTPKVDVPDVTATIGISETLQTNREVSFTADLLLQSHEAGLFEKMMANTSTSLMFNAGPKVSGNWVAGKCVNIYLANCVISSHVLENNNGYMIVKIEAKAFIDESQQDIHINFV